jgi:hypothetical protein
MTEWWLIIAFYWTWFLADCVKLSRHPRLSFSRRRGVRCARASSGHLLMSAPLPTAWQVLVDEPPYSFSPDGLSNQSAASSLPADAGPVSWRWEEIRDIAEKRGRVLINGRDFCPVTSHSGAARLRELAAVCGRLDREARAAFLQARLDAWFRPLRLKRRLEACILRTRVLARLGSVNFALAALVTLYLVFDGPALVGDLWAVRVAALLPPLAVFFAATHVALVILAWRAHRRLMPAQNEQRVRLVLNALLLPPHALRLRAQITAAAFAPQHPLSWFTALGGGQDRTSFARATLAALRWPLAPARTSGASQALVIADWMHARIAPHIGRLLRDAGLDEKKLLEAPEPDGPSSCLYCPRCRDQFTRADARCPRGVKLLALK